MRKVYTLLAGLFAALTIEAQSDFPVQFATEDGTLLASGTVLTLTEAEDDDFGDILVPSRLFVKNTTDANVQIGGVYTIQTMTNGAFQTCFPANCIQKNAVGEYETETGIIVGNQLKDMQTEWLPTAEGTCVVVYQLFTYKQNVITKQWNKDQEGPVITLSFNYSTAGVRAAEAGKAVASVVYYNLTGRKVQKPASGVYIARTTYADGTVRSKKVSR